MMSERRAIGPVDTMWLNMDRPNNLMVIEGVMWFDDPIDRDRLRAVLQRRLVENIQLAQSLGAEVVKLQGEDVAQELIRFATERGVTLAIVGQTRRSRWYRFRRGSVVDRLLAGGVGLDVLVVSPPGAHAARGVPRDDEEPA